MTPPTGSNAFPTIVNLEYDFLKQKGIEYIQALAGKVWTDYNEHDPGITLLEELCYAVVDLNYRTNFYTEDLLAPHPDEPDKEPPQQFYGVEEILPCNPLTANDFLKIVVDVPGVRNAKVLLSEGPQTIKGGYRILLDLEDRVIQRDQEEVVLDDVSQRLYEHRNLCEDFFEIDLLQPLYIRLQASLEIGSNVTHDEGAKLIAKLLFNVQSFLTPHTNFYSLRHMLVNRGMSVEKIYTGPLLEQGFLDEEELIKNNPGATVYTSEILERITSIRDVVNVMKFSTVLLDLEDERSVDQMAIEVPQDSILKLDIDACNVVLYHNGSVMPVSTEKIKQYYDEMAYAYVLSRKYLTEEEIRSPQGRYRHLSEHVSIQDNFPLTYGIGHEGLPKSASKERKAQAKQLRGFLLFFEQLFANYLAQLNHAKDILAVHAKEHKTYFSQIPTGVPQLRELVKFPHIPGEQANDVEYDIQRKYLGVHMPTHKSSKAMHKGKVFEAYQHYLSKIMETKAHYRLKKDQVVDHLLARFAEAFVEYGTLMRGTFNEQAQETIMHDKALFLQDYIAISRDRNKGMDIDALTEQEWGNDNISGFERRIYRALGIRNLRRRFLYETLKNHFYVERGLEHHSLEVFLGEHIAAKHDNLFMFKGNFPKIRNIAIREGADEENYAVVEKPTGGYDVVLYVSKETQKFIQLVNKQLKSIEQANATIKQAVKFFKTFDKESEGFHLVEHILLRTGTTFQGDNDPYSFTMTMVFPAWPSRFQKASFRNLIHSLIVQESPAHVLVNVLWLDVEDMETFEKAYRTWLHQKATIDDDDPQLHHTANNLLGLILLYSNDGL